MTNTYCYAISEQKGGIFLDDAFKKSLQSLSVFQNLISIDALANWRHIINIDMTGKFLDDIASYRCRQGQTCIYVSTSHRCERCCAEYNRALRVQTLLASLHLFSISSLLSSLSLSQRCTCTCWD